MGPPSPLDAQPPRHQDRPGKTRPCSWPAREHRLCIEPKVRTGWPPQRLTMRVGPARPAKTFWGRLSGKPAVGDPHGPGPHPPKAPHQGQHAKANATETERLSSAQETRAASRGKQNCFDAAQAEASPGGSGFRRWRNRASVTMSDPTIQPVSQRRPASPTRAAALSQPVNSRKRMPG